MAGKPKVCPPKDGPTTIQEKKNLIRRQKRRQANRLTSLGVSPDRVRELLARKAGT